MTPMQLFAFNLRLTAAVLRLTADLLDPPRTQSAEPPALLGIYVGNPIQWRQTAWAYATPDGVSLLRRTMTEEECTMMRRAGWVVKS